MGFETLGGRATDGFLVDLGVLFVGFRVVLLLDSWDLPRFGFIFIFFMNPLIFVGFFGWFLGFSWVFVVVSGVLLGFSWFCLIFVVVFGILVDCG